MTDWKPIESAPRDGSSVLLWARLTSVPPESNDHVPIVGAWDKSIHRWKVAPELLNKAEVLDAKFWTELPNSPSG
jgi:hypothetical protein